MEGKVALRAKIEARMTAPDFWNDREKAQKTVADLKSLKATIEPLEEICSALEDLGVLAEIAEEDEAATTEFSGERAALEQRVEKFKFQQTLSGPDDHNNAYLTIHAGAGGTESQDWAEMLLRMYLRWAERRRYQSRVLELSPGDEAGVKSVTLEINGSYAYGYLKAERGVHRLVRLSPFNADHARHTSFALVEVMPEVLGEVEIALDPEELRIDYFRSSGPGGQHMQKSSTAIRITHLSTGIVVTCQNERSQLQNKETALRMLRSRLLEQELERKAEEKARLKGVHVSAGWGNQIRSYVLHPYKMVKDHRTNYETSDPAAVLDGDLDEFLKAYLKSTVEPEG